MKVGIWVGMKVDQTHVRIGNAAPNEWDSFGKHRDQMAFPGRGRKLSALARPGRNQLIKITCERCELRFLERQAFRGEDVKGNIRSNFLPMVTSKPDVEDEKNVSRVS